jgi:hypothetical protein
MLQALFSRQLNAHLVSEAVATILANEEANQRALAEAAGLDPEPLRVRVYIGRSAPITDWIDVTSDTDVSPIINVRLDRTEYPGGNVIEQQRNQVRIPVECFAVGVASQSPDGFVHAETLSLERLYSVVSFARKVLMAAENTYLGMRGVVSKRWIESESYLPVDFDQDPRTQHVRACKLSLVADSYELSPQTTGVPMASVRVRLLKASDGQVLASSLILAEE